MTACLPTPTKKRGRADKILANLEANDLDADAPKIVRRSRKKLSDIPGQMTLF